MAQIGRNELKHRPKQFYQHAGKMPGGSPKHRAKAQQNHQPKGKTHD